MSDPVALALIAAIVTLGTALIGAWSRRPRDNTPSASSSAPTTPAVISQ